MNFNNPNDIMKLLESGAGNNPIFASMLKMVQTNDINGLTSLAKNIARERGLDFDKEFEEFRRRYRF